MRNRNIIKIAPDTIYEIGTDKLPIIPEWSVKDDVKLMAKVRKIAHSTFVGCQSSGSTQPDLTKFTISGSGAVVNITNNGIVSDFSQNAKLLASTFNPGTKPWKIESHLKVNNQLTTGTQEYVLSQFQNNVYIRLMSNGITCEVNAGAWNTDTAASHTFSYSLNTNYLISLEFTGAQYIFKIINLDDNTVRTKSINSTKVIYDGGSATLCIGNHNTNSGLPIKDGEVDLKYFFVSIDGVPVFRGNKTGIDVIKADNYTEAGTVTVTSDGIANGFSSSNYIKTIQCKDLNGKSWTFKCKFYWDNTVTANALIALSGDWYNQGAIGITSTTLAFAARFGNDSESSNEGQKIGISNQFTYDGYYSAVLDFNYNTGTYALSLYNKNGNLLGSDTYTPTVADKQIYAIATNSTGYIRLGYAAGWNAANSIDLNSVQIYADGDLVYQPCLKIPYTEAANYNKTVDIIYRDRVKDLFEQTGYNGYYTLGDSDYTLPSNKLSDVIKHREINGIVAEQRVDMTLTQYGICESGTEVTLPIEYADNNYVLSVPVSAKSSTAFTPSQSGFWMSKGKGVL